MPKATLSQVPMLRYTTYRAGIIKYAPHSLQQAMTKGVSN